MINHSLIGSQVKWNKGTWKITGVRRSASAPGALEFRLLPLNTTLPKEEVWTEPCPTFGDVPLDRLQNELVP